MCMKRILCAMDHSAPSLRAAALAGTVADKFAAELRLLQVIAAIDEEQDDLRRYLQREHDPNPPAVAIADTAQDELQLIADQLATDHGIPVACEVRNGEAISEIIAATRQHASDLLVVGHASRNRLALALVGSTARRLIETAPCPVLVVR
jgi:nucleotide-binding universal stress UspA family protein